MCLFRIFLSFKRLSMLFTWHYKILHICKCHLFLKKLLSFLPPHKMLTSSNRPCLSLYLSLLCILLLALFQLVPIIQILLISPVHLYHYLLTTDSNCWSKSPFHQVFHHCCSILHLLVLALHAIFILYNFLSYDRLPLPIVIYLYCILHYHS